MCLGNDPPQDNSAALARQQEQAREDSVSKGKAGIDSAFSVFDPAYFQKYQQTYLDNYNPELDRQYGVAQQTTGYNNARQGIQDSTAANKNYSDLALDYGNAKQQIASNSSDATNALKDKIDAEKTSLYTQNTAAADPNSAAVEALSAKNSLGTSMTYSPLGSVFSGVASGVGSALTGANNKGLPGNYGALLNGSTLPSSGGSGKVVG